MARPDSAADGDLDMAYGYMLAHHQWGSSGPINYFEEGLKIIRALLAGQRARKVNAFDATFSAPKSASLLWAFGPPEVATEVSLAHVEAVTVVSGNVPLKQATENALYTLELCGAVDPVVAGSRVSGLRAFSSRRALASAEGDHLRR